jgi:hypothetical protein
MDTFYSVPHKHRYISELQKQRVEELVESKLAPLKGNATPEQIIEALQSAEREIFGPEGDGELTYEIDHDAL